jgi:hypothetical protein
MTEVALIPIDSVPDLSDFYLFYKHAKSLRDSRATSVAIATGYGLGDGVSILGRGKRFFLTPQRPDRLWSPPNLLYTGYRVVSPTGKATGE